MKKTIILFISLFSFMVYSQQADYSSYFKTGTKFNVNDLDRFMDQVFIGKTDAIKQTIRYEVYRDLLANRMAVALLPSDKVSTIQSTNDVVLINELNPELTYDKGFDPQTFNPFKYNLNFSPQSSVAYRIGSSDYVIIIISE